MKRSEALERLETFIDKNDYSDITYTGIKELADKLLTFIEKELGMCPGGHVGPGGFYEGIWEPETANDSETERGKAET